MSLVHTTPNPINPRVPLTNCGTVASQSINFLKGAQTLLENKALGKIQSIGETQNYLELGKHYKNLNIRSTITLVMDVATHSQREQSIN